MPPQFRFHECGISHHDGILHFYPPRRQLDIHFSQEPRQRFGAHPTPVTGKVQRLASIMQQLGHEHLDVLKLDVEGSEFDALPDLLASGVWVGQLLVEIHYHFPSRSLAAGLALIGQIKATGMEPAGNLCVSDNATAICETCGETCAARALDSRVTSEHSLSPDDSAWQCEGAAELSGQIESIAQVWTNLPRHVRDSILLLVQAALCE